MKSEELMGIAHQAKELAYAPYSQYKVGAALLAAGGQVYTGVNVENVSYGLTICAERAAVFRAVSAGDLQLEAIAVAGSGAGYIVPCGACLQVLAEFSPNIKIIISNENNEIREYYLNEMLPHQFAMDAGEEEIADGSACPEQPGKLGQDDPTKGDK